MSRKVPVDKIQAQLHQAHGDTVSLVVDTYVGADEKATFIDKEYGSWEAVVYNVVRGGRCPKRYRATRKAPRETLLLAEVESRVEEVHGGTVTILPETYISGARKATFVDKDYGSWQAKVLQVLHGSEHPQRSKIRTPGNGSLTIGEVCQQIYEKHGDKVSVKEDTYRGTAKKATFIDKDYGEWESTANNVLRGSGHPKRYRDSHTKYWWGAESLANVARSRGVPMATAVSQAQKYGIQAVLSYIEQNTDNKGQYVQNVSCLERMFADLLENSGILVERWDRKVPEFKGACTDLRLYPDFRLSYSDRVVYVDVHGLYVHSDGYHLAKSFDSKYHTKRREVFTHQMVPFLQFFEDEVRDQGAIIKSLLLSRFGLADSKYQARKLAIREVGPFTANEFFQKNHLMGSGPSSKSVGLFSGEELVCCLSYRRSMRRGKLEISRFASKLNSSVAGGFGRLVSYLKQFNLPVLSYCDLRYATGKSYQALGFEDKGTTLGFNWTDCQHRMPRTSCKAGNGKTEAQNALERGLYKIYDAGQRRYELTYILGEQNRG